MKAIDEVIKNLNLRVTLRADGMDNEARNIPSIVSNVLYLDNKAQAIVPPTKM